jgi:hypothetical protein
MIRITVVLFIIYSLTSKDAALLTSKSFLMVTPSMPLIETFPFWITTAPFGLVVVTSLPTKTSFATIFLLICYLFGAKIMEKEQTDKKKSR